MRRKVPALAGHELPTLEVAILCAFEGLGARYDAQSCDCGLNLSVALRNPELEDVADPRLAGLLSPWTWKLAGVRTWNPAKAGAGGLATAQILTPNAVTAPAEDSAAARELLGLLADELERLLRLKNARALSWNPGAGQAIKKDKGFGHPWHVQLAQTAHYPAPLPQLLNLSMIARAPFQPAGSSLLGAPVFEVELQGKRLSCEPAASGPCLWHDGSFYAWPYSLRWSGAVADSGSAPSEAVPWRSAHGQEMGLRLTLFVNAGRVPDLPAPGKCWTSDPQWIESQSARSGYLDQDWRTTLEPRLAEAFDLAQRLIDWGRGRVKQLPPGDDKSQTKALLEMLRSSVVATLHDLVREPAAAAASGQSWPQRLVARLPEVRGLAALLGLPPGDAKKELADLDLLQSTLALDQNLQRLAIDPAAVAVSPGAGGDEAGGLRQSLARENLQVSWDGIVGECQRRVAAGQPETEGLRGAIVWGLVQFAQLRLRVEPLDPYTRYQALPTDPPSALLDDFTSYLAKWGADYVSRLLPPEVQQGQGLGCASSPHLGGVVPVPHGVTFPVGSMVPKAADHPGSKINGYGVLLRGPSKKTWRCLNMAAVSVGARQAARGAIVPVPLHDSNGLANAFVTYENFPLMAASTPQCQLTAAFPFKAPAGNTDEAGNPPRVTYSYPLPEAAAEKDWALLPALIFRPKDAVYGALAFTVSNSGALPAELARSDDPTRLRPAAEAAARLAAAPCKAHVRPFPYQRRVPIGEVWVECVPEMCGAAAAGGAAGTAGIVGAATAAPGPQEGPGAGDVASSRLHLPVIPPTVLPLARELAAGASAVPAVGACAAPAGYKGVPLLLLTPWTDRALPSQFSFRVRKPSIDLETWDRWVGASDSLRPLRARVRAAMHRAAVRRLSAGRPMSDSRALGATQGEGVWLDDPAVSGLEVELAAVADNGAVSVVETLPFPRSADLSSSAHDEVLLKALRAAPVTVRCTWSGAAGTPSLRRLAVPSQDADLVEAAVPEGSVAQLRAFAMVRAADAARMAAEVVALGEKVSRQGGDWYRFAAFTLLIEVATRELPPAAALRGALSSHFDAGTNKLRFEVRRNGALRTLGRAELMRQVWRWGGREIGPLCFPPLRSGSAGTASGAAGKIPSLPPLEPGGLQAVEQNDLLGRLALWDVEGFGDRTDADHLVVAMARGHQDQEPLFQTEEDLGKDLRALYYRFAARGFSRYEGLDLPCGQQVESWLMAARQSSAGGNQCQRREESLGPLSGPPPAVAWHRQIVPCRQAKEVPKPPVRVVLPLTEAPSEAGTCTGQASCPGLLIVVNGAWYQFGGLAEVLEAEVVTSEDPTDGQHRQVWQIGPDPILTADRADTWLAGTDTVIPNVRGPVGHTFDSSGAAPLITSTSFVLPPPARDVDFSWYFAQLRFRRILTAAGTADGMVRSSAYTSPHWVQFLPPASCFDTSGGGHVDVRGLRLAAAGATLRLLGPDGKPVEPAHPNGGDEVFHHFLAVTERIWNAAGGREERFVGIFAPAGGGAWQPEDGAAIDLAGKALRARVIEVQVPPHAASSATPAGDASPAGGGGATGGKRGLWDSLFPDQEQADAAARIVRCSAPIDDGAPLDAPAGERG